MIFYLMHKNLVVAKMNIDNLGGLSGVVSTNKV